MLRGVMSENGATNGGQWSARELQRFPINGASNKGLSGGVQPVLSRTRSRSFKELTLNIPSQYGNSAGSMTNLVTKSGTNAYHGSGWEFPRNSCFNISS